MRILIVGGAGYVGSVLTNIFLKHGHKVVVLDLLSRGSDGVIPHKSNKRFHLINADYMNGILPLALKGVDFVVHLAGIIGDPACEASPELAIRTNVEGIHLLAKYCNEANVKMVFYASTASVYGSNTEVCTEETPINPLSHYARTKLRAEDILLKESNNFLIFRFGTMYGLSPNMRYDLIVNRLVRDAVKKGECNVYDGKQYRGFFHPRDLAYFLMYLFKKDLSQFNKQTYNLVSENLSMLQIGQLITLMMPYAKLKLSQEKEDDRTYICSSFKAYLELGFSPQIRVRDGIMAMELNLLRKNTGYSIPKKEVNYY